MGRDIIWRSYRRLPRRRRTKQVSVRIRSGERLPQGKLVSAWELGDGSLYLLVEQAV